MILKTTEARLAELETHVLEAHPYDTPEFVAWPLATGGALPRMAHRQHCHW